MGMLNSLSLNPESKFSHIPQASFPEFVIEGHYYTSPNSQEEPPTFFFSHSEPLPDDASPTQFRGRVWALDNYPYLPFILFSPFHGSSSESVTSPVFGTMSLLPSTLFFLDSSLYDRIRVRYDVCYPQLLFFSAPPSMTTTDPIRI
jgi:hypothetical protein